MGLGPVLPFLTVDRRKVQPRGHAPPRRNGRRYDRREARRSSPRRRVRSRRAHASHRGPLAREGRGHHDQRLPSETSPYSQPESRARLALRGRVRELPRDAIPGQQLRRRVLDRGHLPRAEAGGGLRRDLQGFEARIYVRVVRMGHHREVQR